METRMRFCAFKAWVLLGAICSICAYAQSGNYPYVLKTVAGGLPNGDGGSATSAILQKPHQALQDNAGNIYVLDAGNYAIRKISPSGVISTVSELPDYGFDMKLSPDKKNLYVASYYRIYRVPLAGQFAGIAASIAGTGTMGFTGDEGPATNAQMGIINQIDVDPSGNIYLADVQNQRIRKIGADGIIRTIAGTGVAGYSGDGGRATSATFVLPSGVAFEPVSGNVYIADTFNLRVRKVTPDGLISTVGGNGSFAKPIGGPGIASPLGLSFDLAADGSGNIYVIDSAFSVLLKLSAGGLWSIAAGNSSTKPFPYADGPAFNTAFGNIYNCSVDNAGNVLIADSQAHLIRRLSTSGNVTTIAGKVHYSGDGGPATNALLNSPSDVALDGTGAILIADSDNYAIRRLAPDGVIRTMAGNGNYGYPASDGTPIADSSQSLPSIGQLALDAAGGIYAAGSASRVLKIANSLFATVAGTGTSGDGGDGGPATRAQFKNPSGVAIDAAGNVYVADSTANRVRKISKDGTISAFAGTGKAGSAGDGGLATAAQLRLLYNSTPLAVDAVGNVYIADQGNYKVRMVDPSGVITSVVGNGNFGKPTNGAKAASQPFSSPAGLAFDSKGNLYISSADYPQVYRVDPTGVIQRISGGSSGSLKDGALADSVSFFAMGMRVSDSGDVIAADSYNNAVRQLVLNSPKAFTMTDGNSQSGIVRTDLPKLLRVSVTGRAGVGVPGVQVTFAVVSGSATLSTTTTLTDSTGTAAAKLTLGSTAGSVTITASATGTGLPNLQFTETATASNPNCTIPSPTITSAASLGDFGGIKTFAAGSWIEVKGTNLSSTTRSWTGADFQGGNAPTGLDGTTVLINGKPAFVQYISPTQINVQAPSDSTLGPVPLVVTNCAGPSAAFSLQEAPVAPGMLAPGSFNIGGKQYLVAIFTDGVTYVGSEGLIAGVPFRPANPGDTILAYGIGFGSVSPGVGPGIVVGQNNSLSNVTVSFDQTAATLDYAGLATGAIGLYQFNIKVPEVPDGDYPIRISVAGTPLAQMLYLTVKN